MDIFINDKPADITLDTEKNLGDVLAGIESWLSISGNRIQRIGVNGKDVCCDSLTEEFDRELKDIEKLDIAVSSWRELAAEALGTLLEICALHENSSFAERGNVFTLWENSAAAHFTASEMPEVCDFAARTLSGEGPSPGDLVLLINERLREIADPVQETAGCETPVKNIVQRMEELPLDLQTGKDQQAAETVMLFSRMAEKLFRILFIQKRDGLSLDTFVIDDLDERTFMEEFNAALKELSAAYENRDMVLAGDIAEYELAPRLLKFFTALKDS